MKTYALPFCNKHELYFILNSGNEIKTNITKLKLDVDPQRDDDASPMSTYRREC